MSQCHLQLYRLLLDESNGLSHTVLAVSTADAVDDTSAAVSDDITADTTTADVDDTVADVDTAIAGTDNTIANADKTATDAAATDDSMFYNIAMVQMLYFILISIYSMYIYLVILQYSDAIKNRKKVRHNCTELRKRLFSLLYFHMDQYRIYQLFCFSHLLHCEFIIHE